MRQLACLVSRALLVRERTEQRIDAPELGESLVRLGDLAFEMRDLLAAFFRSQLQPVLRGAALLRLDHLADLGQREAELLALDDHGEAVAVLAAEDAAPPVALRREQATALIEAQRTVGQVELAGELVDTVFGLGIG